MRGILAIDPGESTGVAWGIVDDKTRGKAYEAVAERLHGNSTTISGEEASQIRALYRLWTDFKKLCVQTALLDPKDIDLVIEDFVLFPGEKPGRATTTPERIAWGFEGYRMAQFDAYRRSWPKHYTPVTWQKSGAAYRFKSDRQLMFNAGIWIRGKEHERSAFAHVLLRTNVLLDNRR
jgi:hypothetical protein